MEQIRIKPNETLYDIEEISRVTSNVLKIVFADNLPPQYGDILLYTAGGYDATTLSGYDTLYRQDGNVVWLSNDGEVYQEPEPMPDPAPYIPTLEELKVKKKQVVTAACEQHIYAGINVSLTDGSTGHYSLTVEDQLNLFGKLSQISAGALQVEYHADGQPCRYYAAADMKQIIEAAMWHVSYHTTYCNALNMWIAGCQSSEELQVVCYGADVPEQYQSDVLKTYLLQIASAAGGEDSAV